MQLITFIILTVVLFRAECAKILAVFPAPGYSQWILGEVLTTELAKRGHEVTVISPYRPKIEPPNYKTILTKEVIEGTSGGIDLYSLATANLFINILTTYEYGNVITEQTLKNKEVQKLLLSNKQFDLVILEQFFDDALKGFAAHFKAPLVLFSSMGLTEWNSRYIGNPMLPTINPVIYTSYTNQMRFFQRIKNVAGAIFDYSYANYVYKPIQRGYLKKYFPQSMDFDQIINNGSLMLINSHVTTTENVLLNQNVIEIGGFHVTQDPLSKDVQEYLDGALDGAILFSLGSNIRSSDLSEELIKGIFRIFGNLKERILWKFEKDWPDKPKNIFISKWLQQKDILAHPNTKLFITHGGMLSTTEAVFHGVPMVGIPVFADQRMNMARAKSKGIAEAVPFPELSEETLFLALNATLSDPKYRNNMKTMATLMKDRAVKPLDLAMYWIEYVLRNEGIRFEAASSKLYWFEMYMIDILCFMALNFLIVCLLIRSTIQFFRRHVGNCANEVKRKQQ